MTTLPIQLPDGFHPKITVGDSVNIGQIIAQKELKLEEIIDLSKELSLSAKAVAKTVKKNPGDHIAPGDIVALKKGFFGEKKVLSSIAGTVIRFERNTGILAIKRDSPKLNGDTIVSPLDGTISLCNNETIQIQTDKNVCLGEAGIGQAIEAKLIKADGLSRTQNIKDNEIIPADLTPDLIGNVVIGGKFNREVLTKAVGMGIVGVVASEISITDLEYLKTKNLQLTAIVLSKEEMEKVEQWVGNLVYVDGKGKTIMLLIYEKHV